MFIITEEEFKDYLQLMEDAILARSIHREMIEKELADSLYGETNYSTILETYEKVEKLPKVIKYVLNL